MRQFPAGTDQESFVAFVQARQHRLLRSAYLICGDPHLAEDLLQGALVKLALRWRQVRDGEPEAYLRTILYRDAVSWWRRTRREQLTDAPGADPARRGPHTGVGVVADAGEAASVRVVFAQALRRLTPRQRAVLVLRYFDDLSEARAAEILGVSIGTVKSQTSDALRRLRTAAPELAELIQPGRETP
ncbi:MAG TPA: SigE family RNA polymerase sigma factor [Micromonosporaceae bacterium]